MFGGVGVSSECLSPRPPALYAAGTRRPRAGTAAGREPGTGVRGCLGLAFAPHHAPGLAATSAPPTPATSSLSRPRVSALLGVEGGQGNSPLALQPHRGSPERPPHSQGCVWTWARAPLVSLLGDLGRPCGPGAPCEVPLTPCTENKRFLSFREKNVW